MEQLNYPEQYNKLIISFLESPELAYRVDEGLLAQLIEKYPFSQPLYLISASKKKDDQNELSLAAAYAAQREVLYAIVKHPGEFKYKTGPKLLETTADAVEADILTGNAVEPPSHLEHITGPGYEPAEEDGHSAGLPEDAASGDPVFAQVIDAAEEEVHEVHGEAPADDAVEEDPIQEEIAEVPSPYETRPAEIVSSSHDSFESDEAGLPVEEDFDIETVESESEPENETEEAPYSTDEEKPGNSINEEEEALEEENLIGSIAGSDFFAFERSAVDPLQAEVPKRSAGRKPGERNLSKYNDDKLPYTFLWWLNKTRKEHAETYQPYADFSLDTSQAISRAAPVEELNHQIIENIFHLQTPLDDIAKEAPANTVHFELKRKEDVIIEKFIKEEPQIKPPQPEKIDNENKARRSAEDPNDLVSETLARIYTDQMLYQKAIDTYKKLSLKFPEKSTYFADQIVELEKKIN